MRWSEDRAANLAEVITELTKTMADEYDVVELLNRLVRYCLELLGFDDAGLVLADLDGQLKVVVSTSEQARFLEILQLHAGSGPCLDCYRSGKSVHVEDLGKNADRWPVLANMARGGGYRAVHAVPLKFRDQTVGAMNLLSAAPFRLELAEYKIARALAEVATLAIVSQRARRRAEQVAEQLQGALNSRVVIEQAKGMLAQQGGLDVVAAFAALRQYARRNNRRLTEVARDVVNGSLSLQEMSGQDTLRAVQTGESIKKKRSSSRSAPHDASGLSGS
jgi:GAF domain-containing protein